MRSVEHQQNIGHLALLYLSSQSHFQLVRQNSLVDGEILLSHFCSVGLKMQAGSLFYSKIDGRFLGPKLTTLARPPTQLSRIFASYINGRQRFPPRP